MGRTLITTRTARREDASVLAELWTDVLRRADRSEQAADLELVIKQAASSPEQRFVVVDYDGQPAGAVLLRLTTLSPINLEPCIQAIQPRVLPEYRRHGVGRALMEAATCFAEEEGVVVVSTVVPSATREGNRFMARLGLTQAASWRVAPTSLLRSRLSPQQPSVSAAGRSRLIAARRSARRLRAIDEVPDLDLPVAPDLGEEPLAGEG
ncbi:GNAT family N-acetyltransferase [Nocardioides sp. YIM 152588]|uniref:GNAT family N-acetyltransferase n=1 Tax=Nocardioides sp. YIM 152588 TaxID=3158259 RepID=UPI0032E4E99E